MPETTPLLSVVVPVFNGEAFLLQAVKSIRSQAYHPLEIIVVDDGSTDGSPSIIAGLGPDVIALQQMNRGPAAARNTGLKHARGTLIAFLDADDIWPPDKLTHQAHVLLQHPEHEVVLGKIQQVRDAQDHDLILEGEAVIHAHLGGALFRRSVFDRVGLFDEQLEYSEDHDWFLRAREMNVSMAQVDRTTLYYRQHDGNMTRGRTIGDMQMLDVLKRSLDRRRTSGQFNLRKLSDTPVSKTAQESGPGD